MKTRKELAKATATRYQKANRSRKSAILDEFCASTQYRRDYAATLLCSMSDRRLPAKRSEFLKASRKRTGRPPVYDQDIIRILGMIWRLFDHICSKRLVPLIRSSILMLQKHELLRISPDQALLLSSISPSTVDHVLKLSRKADMLHGHCYTRPNGGLKESIPVRTFGEWQFCPPGHCQLDTVGHDGGVMAKECSFTLCLTDVYSGWTERYAMQNRAFKWVRMGLDVMKAAVPFPLLHLHPDNGRVHTLWIA